MPVEPFLLFFTFLLLLTCLYVLIVLHPFLLVNAILHLIKCFISESSADSGWSDTKWVFSGECSNFDCLIILVWAFKYWSKKYFSLQNKIFFTAKRFGTWPCPHIHKRRGIKIFFFDYWHIQLFTIHSWLLVLKR